MSSMYELARTYIVIECGEVPPFILAEVVGCAVEPEAGLYPGGTWSSLTTNAEEMNSNSAGSVYTREQLEADPCLRRALERWEAGDDSSAAEYERRILIQYGGVPWGDEAAQEQARDSGQHEERMAQNEAASAVGFKSPRPTRSG